MKRLKHWLPPELIRLGKHMLGRGAHFRGDFVNWEEAVTKTDGYDAAPILDRVCKATLAVRDGAAIFERDGVLFDARHDPYPLLAALMRAATLSDGKLCVHDFGGALGSSYFQCKPWLADLTKVTWCVIEQPHFVETGNAKLADASLTFAESFEKASSYGMPDIVLFSGVLQYLPDPMTILAQTLEVRPRFIMIDRTPIIAGDRNIIRLQKQSGGLIRSSYPVRLFGEQNLLEPMTKEYTLLSTFDALDGSMGGWGERVDFKGFIFERNTARHA
jgi:putative methyltransferase (TIGR04325 family)